MNSWTDEMQKLSDDQLKALAVDLQSMKFDLQHMELAITPPGRMLELSIEMGEKLVDEEVRRRGNV